MRNIFFILYSVLLLQLFVKIHGKMASHMTEYFSHSVATNPSGPGGQVNQAPPLDGTNAPAEWPQAFRYGPFLGFRGH